MPTPSQGPVTQFKYIRVSFTSDRREKSKIHKRIGAASTVRTDAVELSIKAKQWTSLGKVFWARPTGRRSWDRPRTRRRNYIAGLGTS